MSDDTFSIRTHHEDCSAALIGADCDCPGPRRYIAVDVIETLLPNVYDGMHLVDCPYVDVLLRVRKALLPDDERSNT